MKLLTALLLATAAYAGPVMNSDGIFVPFDAPGVGEHAYVIPMSEAVAWGNDNPPPTYGDHDLNDGKLDLFFGLGGTLNAFWGGSHSAWMNYWLVEGQRVDANNLSAAITGLTVGSKLDLVFVAQDGGRYATGSVNVAVIQTPDGPAVPEPSTGIMIVAGLAFIAIGVNWRKR